MCETAPRISQELDQIAVLSELDFEQRTAEEPVVEVVVAIVADPA